MNDKVTLVTLTTSAISFSPLRVSNCKPRSSNKVRVLSAASRPKVRFQQSLAKLGFSNVGDRISEDLENSQENVDLIMITHTLSDDRI